MITSYVVMGVVGLIGLGVSAFLIYMIKEEGGVGNIIGLLVTLVITISICGGIYWWLNNTEGGKRAIKDTKSNLSGGVERVVTVYDFNGDVLQEYSGKFDVDYDSERIKFDDENGKRHVIYYKTGTVIIDER